MSAATPISRICRITGNPFVISPLEQEIAKKCNAPLPTAGPVERMRNVSAFSNYLNFYHGKCGLTGEKILQIYRPDVPFPVYSNPAYWSDAWDPLSYGREYNFQKTFFEQIYSLRNVVPQQAMSVIYSALENCDYINAASYCKNCYLIFSASYNEDCYYCLFIWHSKDCVDCSSIIKCELCCDSSFMEGCYGIRHSFNCLNCQNSAFLHNCVGCSDCFGCVNLRHRKYCWYNEQLSETEYKSRIASIPFDSFEFISNESSHFLQFAKKHPQPAVRGLEFHGSTGDFLNHCDNSVNCYGCSEIQDCANCVRIAKSHDCMDVVAFGGDCELIYCSSRAVFNCSNIKFSSITFSNCSDLEYCIFCSNSKNCFGCIGLRNKEYCILNKQYRREEYFELKARIIKQMLDPKVNGGLPQYGEYFPYRISPFPFNDSDAAFYFPLNKDGVLARGGYWIDDPRPTQSETTPSSALPDRTADASEGVSQNVYCCAETEMPFRITAKELALYRRHNLPLPRKHWKTRLLGREKLRNPFELCEQSCAKTGTQILTSFPPNSGWTVWDSDEFQKTVNQ